MDNSVAPDGAWPAWATEDVTLTSPDVEYPAHARSYTAEVAHLLAGAAHRDDREAYTAAKASYVARVVADPATG